MLKISLYQNFCIPLCKQKNIHSYRKNKSYTTDRAATSATGRGLSPRQETLIPYVLSYGTSEIHWPNLETGWSTDRNDPYIRQFLGEMFQVRRYQRSVDTSWPWSQTDHGLLGRRSEREYLQGFLPALVRDIDV